jgi:hypothetical protein
MGNLGACQKSGMAVKRLNHVLEMRREEVELG